jgi:hypothetical protein
VVQEGGLGREPLHAHEFLAVEPAVGPLEADVALPGKFADAPVVGHGGTLRSRRDRGPTPAFATALGKRSMTVSHDLEAGRSGWAQIKTKLT